MEYKLSGYRCQNKRFIIEKYPEFIRDIEGDFQLDWGFSIVAK